MKLFLLMLFVFSSGVAATNDKPVQERDSLLIIDYSSIWLTEQDEIIGYIGDNYQRFRIRFLSIEQDEDDRLSYNVKGKTMVKNIICDFTGEIHVDEVRIFKTTPRQKAVIRGKYYFKEDTAQSHSGSFTGKFTSYVYWKNGKVLFDDLAWGISDPYHNNQFEGKWTDYQTGKSKKCNWGIARIPDSKGLDIGAGLFSPDPIYNENGWETYPDGGASNPPYEEQLKIDTPEWW